MAALRRIVQVMNARVGVGGVAEEEVVLNAHVGNNGHGNLDEAAFVGCRDKVERGECQSEDRAEEIGHAEAGR